MNKKIFIPVFLLLCALSLSAAAKETPEQILLSLPQKVGNFTAQDPRIYKHPALGASRGWDANKHTPDFVAVTVYIYDLGLSYIEDGIESETIVSAKKEAMRTINSFATKGTYLNLKIINNAPLELDMGEASILKVLSIAYSHTPAYKRNTDEPEPVYSDLLLVGLKGYICKLRITRSQSISPKIEEEIYSLIKTLLKTIAG